MKKIIFFSIVTILACSPKSKKTAGISEIKDGANAFKEFGYEGSFMAWCAETDSTFYCNALDTGKAWLPASTFKVLLTHIALESGYVQNETDTIPWNRVKMQREVCNQSMNLNTAYITSCEWLFRAIARETGREKLKKWMQDCKYGNMQLYDTAEYAWLLGPLRINHRQQIAFMHSIQTQTAPFSKRTFGITKRIMLQDSATNFILRGKSGWSQGDSMSVGWYVGWLEKGGKTWFYSNRIYSTARKEPENFGKARIDIARKLLGKLAGDLE